MSKLLKNKTFRLALILAVVYFVIQMTNDGEKIELMTMKWKNGGKNWASWHNVREQDWDTRVESKKKCSKRKWHDARRNKSDKDMFNEGAHPRSHDYINAKAARVCAKYGPNFLPYKLARNGCRKGLARYKCAEVPEDHYISATHYKDWRTNHHQKNWNEYLDSKWWGKWHTKTRNHEFSEDKPYKPNQ